MKHLYLIETVRDGLKTVRKILEEMNAKYTVFNSVAEASRSGAAPDMLILLADRNEAVYRNDVRALSAEPLLRSVARVSVLPLGLSMNRKTATVIEGEREFPLPLERSKFVSELETCLNISQRRTFQIIVTMTMPESNLQYSGMSLDFSATGMGCESRADFQIGQGIRISFVNPKTKMRLSLHGEIMRKVASKEASKFLYGIKFVDLQMEESAELNRFISG